jgi:ADP-ribose pyrophosphatase
LLHGFFEVEEAELRFERFDGRMSQTVERMHLDRGRAAAVLLYHTEREQFLLVRQFRFAAWTKGQGWLTEIVAGKIDDGETPEQAAQREVEEETGYRIPQPQTLSVFFTMPGGSSERIHLFFAEIDETMRAENGGKSADADEDLLPVWVDAAEVRDGSACFRFPDAKTQVALNWWRAESMAGKTTNNR